MSLVYKIHPALGIARLGDSETGWFLGPQAPGVPVNPGRGFKDEGGRVKRQGAMFRLFEHGPDGQVLREVTARDAEIRWTVHVANRKAAGPRFLFLAMQPYLKQDLNPVLQGLMVRNSFVAARNELVLDSGPVPAAGPSTPLEGYFLGNKVKLGDLLLDEQGRLIVLGGHGRSESPADPRPFSPAATPMTPSFPGGCPMTDFSDNDGWFDDTSDGTVKATVTLDGRTVEAAPARVLCAPPDFAPAMPNVVSLYDVAYDLAVRHFGHPQPARPSFAEHVYPILERVARLAWVADEESAHHHGPGRIWDFLRPPRLKALADADPDAAKFRRFVFERLRDPDGAPDQPGTMPRLGYWPDLQAGGWVPLEPLTLTRTQYGWMKRWTDGDFDPGLPEEAAPRPYEDLPLQERPGALDRAALEAASGGPFFPGLETNWIVTRPETWQGPFRIKEDLAPGGLTEGNPVPWQADFVQCGHGWWPSERPNLVARNGGLEPWVPVDWENFANPSRFQSMVDHWSRLGFAVAEAGGYREVERSGALEER